MITWFCGNSGSGKTTLTDLLVANNYLVDTEEVEQGEDNPYRNVVVLDGDRMRGIWTDLGLSKADRWEQNMRVARMAKMLETQGFNVAVSVICPYAKLRKEVKAITDCKFIYIEGGKEGKDYPFDKPKLY